MLQKKTAAEDITKAGYFSAITLLLNSSNKYRTNTKNEMPSIPPNTTPLSAKIIVVIEPSTNETRNRNKGYSLVLKKFSTCGEMNRNMMTNRKVLSTEPKKNGNENNRQYSKFPTIRPVSSANVLNKKPESAKSIIFIAEINNVNKRENDIFWCFFTYYT